MPLSLRRTRGSWRCRWLLAALLTLTLVLPLGPLAPALDAAVVGEGRGFSWGENEHGQLGDFDGGNDSRTPVPVDGARRFVAVSAGGNHSLAVAADGTVWSWGLNSSGELGIGGSFIFPHDVPTQVEPTWPTGTVIVAVAAGQAHSLALTSDGTVWTWGDNSSGQLGNSDGGNDSGVPTKVGNTGPGGHVIARIAAGGFFSLALTNTGAVYTWGENGSGQLGNDDVTNTDLDQLSATLNFGGATIVAIAGGGEHALALTDDGTVWTWGESDAYQTGQNDTTDDLAPLKVLGTGPGLGEVAFAAIAAGGDHSLALTADGTLYGWGENGIGQIGIAAGADIPLVQVVPGTGPGAGNLAFTAIDGGGLHTLALITDGTAYGWGGNNSGQLGDGTITARSTPAPVSGTGPLGTPLFSISAGSRHSLSLAPQPTAASAVGGTATFSDANVTLTAIFTLQGSSEPVPAGGTVTFAFNGQDYSGTTDALGVATAVAPLPPGTDADTYPSAVLASYAGATGFGLSSGLGSVVVAKAAQTITFAQPPGAIVGDAPFAVSATASSGLTVAFAADPPAVCTSSGSNGATITLVGAGNCTVTASQAGDSNWLAATPVDRVVAVASPSPAPSPSVVPDPGFADVRPGDPGYEAIAALVERGVIKGYNTTPPTFGPADNVRRSQVAAMLVRALGWQGRATDPRSFPDLGNQNDELTRAALILANACDGLGRCVAGGYTDGRFGPYDDVSYAQVVAFVSRAFVLDRGTAWTPQQGGAPYTGVPGGFADEIATYHANAGTIPDAPTTAAGWDVPAPRVWIAQLLWQALQSTP